MQMYAGREMLAYDYVLEPNRFSISNRVRFRTVDWPLNLGRMFAWRGLEAIQHNFPTVLGRKPGQRMIVAPYKTVSSKPEVT